MLPYATADAAAAAAVPSSDRKSAATGGGDTTLLQAQRKTKSRWQYASKHARLHRADTRLAGWHSGNGDQPHELMYVHTADCSAMACVPVIDTLCDRAGVIGAPEMRCTICPLVLWAKPDERWRYSEVSSTSTRGAYAYAYAYPHIPARTQERRARPRRRSPLASLGSRSASPVTALGCRGCESRADRQVLALQNKACAPHRTPWVSERERPGKQRTPRESQRSQHHSSLGSPCLDYSKPPGLPEGRCALAGPSVCEAQSRLLPHLGYMERTERVRARSRPPPCAALGPTPGILHRSIVHGIA